MIEIELKYKIAKQPDLSGFTLKSEKSQKDIYFDTKEYDLIRGGNFVRVRNDKRIDFKLDISDDSKHFYCKETSFDVASINDKNKDFLNVFKAINVAVKGGFNNFDQFIEVNDFVVLSPIIKQRKTYTKGESKIVISVDEVEKMGLFLEAEIVIDDNDNADKNQIIAQEEKFLIENKLITPNDKRLDYGYVELYLFEHNIKAYELGKYKTC